MEDFLSRVPWSREPSLEERAQEVGVDFDRFMVLLSQQSSDGEIAGELGVSEELVRRLRERFERYGVQSVEGQD